MLGFFNENVRNSIGLYMGYPIETEERIQKAAAALLEASNRSDIGGFGHGGGGGLVRLNPVDLYPSLTLSRVPLHYHF
uniref:Uncharacterized protein n=1 Tax=Oryza barthii TaxID=65489 RepID=A0A0D3GEW6_9ORYZ